MVQHRIGLLTEIIRLLLKMVPDQRRNVLKEESAEYLCDPTSENLGEMIVVTGQAQLFENVPLP